MKSHRAFGKPVPIRGGSGDGTQRSDEPLAVGVPLAKLIRRKIIATPDMVMITQPRSLPAERFRRLKTKLVNQHADALHVIVVTSPSPGEGKTTVSTNLALAFAADKNDRTLLIDADLRRPSVERVLEPKPKLGLTEILGGRADVDHAILSLENSPLEVLPAGSKAEDPSELLSSDRARDLIKELRSRYGRIIIDTPPIVPFTDADAVGSLSDGIVLVARIGETSTVRFQQAVAAVTSTQILGAVHNDLAASLADWQRYDGYDYDRYYDKERKK